MLIFLTVLYVLSAILPVWGIARLLRGAFAAAKAVREAPASTSPGVPSYAAVQAAMPAVVGGVASRPKAVLLDFAFIGSGVVLGAVASIWSLFLP